MATFFAPGFDQQVEQQNIDRQRQYAQALRKQSSEMPDGRMVGRTYVAPSWTEGLAQMLQAYQGGQVERGADEKQKALADAVRGRTSQEMWQFTNLITGTPARDIQPLTPNDDEGNAMPVARAEAQAPDLAGAYKFAAGANTPALQQIGVQGALSAAQEQAKLSQANTERMRIAQIIKGAGSPQAAIAAGVPAEAVKAFYESNNYGRDKVNFQDVGGQKVPVTEYGDTPEGVAPLQKTGNPFSDLVVRGTDGKIIPNAPLVAVKGDIASKGAAKTNVSVNMPDKKFYEGLGAAVSGQIEKGFEQAQSAAQTLSNANQIASGIEKSFVGPLANQRVTLAQLGQVLGITGKDTQETLLNTRNVIQGLARQELAAAGQMKGQGQITESERAILRKAESGDISTFTKPELQLFTGAIRKTARSRIATHQRNLQNLGSDPQAGTILPYLQVEVPKDFPIGGSSSSVLDQADAIINGGKSKGAK